MSNNDKFIDHISPLELDGFLGRIMMQMKENDPVKVVNLINSGEVYLANIKTGWEKTDDIVSFSVISDSTSGPQWLKRLKNKGIYVDDTARKMLLSKDFKPTDEVVTKVVAFKVPYAMFGETDPLPIAESKGLIEPINGMELACLMRDKFTNQQFLLMGFSKLAISVGDFHFYITGGDQQRTGLGAFKKRMDSDFAYVFQEK
jgi:hypothetical protein